MVAFDSIFKTDNQAPDSVHVVTRRGNILKKAVYFQKAIGYFTGTDMILPYELNTKTNLGNFYLVEPL